jgi:ribosomal protein S16
MVKIIFSRIGKKNKPFYRLIVLDKKKDKKNPSFNFK